METKSSGAIKSRIIIADDDKENLSLVEQALKLDGHQIRSCSNGEEVLHLIKSWSPHIVILDINMPVMTGLECLAHIRRTVNASSDYVGVVLVTANSALEEIVYGLDLGADDYIVKPFRLDELRARVRSCLRIKNLNDLLKKANKKLEDLSNHDEVTGLFNMRYMFKKIPEEIIKIQQNQSSISCIMFDLDRFKTVNDTHDHLFGSYVIKEVGEILKKCLRDTDFSARYGGDEYLLILPNANQQEAWMVAERIRKTIELTTFKLENYSTKITASFGLVSIDFLTRTSSLPAKELIRNADFALYNAKQNGRNRVEIFSSVL